jgi:hypothetical protein
MTGQGDRRFGSSSSGWGLHLLSWVVSSPSSDRRWPNRIRYVGVGATFGRRPVFSYRPRSLTLAPAFASDSPSGFGTPRLARSPLATWRSGDHLLSPSAPLMRCPGAVTPPRRLARGSVRPRPASSPEERILRRCSGSLAMPRSEDRLVARLPSFRRRGLGGPPSIPTKTWRSGKLVCREGRENGESGEGKRGRGVGGPSVVRWASRTGRWTHSFPSRRDRRDRAPTSARCCCSGPRSAGCRCPRRRSPHWMGTWDGVGQCECMDPQYICAEEPAVLVSQ